MGGGVILPDGNQYHDDFQAWAIDQAARLRVAATVQAEELEGIDFEHLVEEVEDLGRSDVLKVQSLVRQALSHLIKIVSDPGSEAVAHWEREVMTFALDASDAYGRSYRQRIDMDIIWRKAKREAGLNLKQHGMELPSLSSDCPVDLDWMMGDAFTVDEAKAMVAAAIEA
jgi:hypothetical protein